MINPQRFIAVSISVLAHVFRASGMRWLLSSWSNLVLAGMLLSGCGGGRADCSNGECVCVSGGKCDFTCASPPCHVDCEDGSDCSGTCANGNCICGAGSDCAFECESGPCHVDCVSASDCSGTCENGTCHCGAGSTCEFSCLDSNCKMDCEGACRVRCDAGKTCAINSCASGAALTCPDGDWVVCGMDCPKAESTP